MCGICAIYCSRGNHDLRQQIEKLRHRGYDSWGVCSWDERQVFQGCPPSEATDFRPMTGATHIIGHARYTTRGSPTSTDQFQPLVMGDFSLVHNGQIAAKSDESDTTALLRWIKDNFRPTPSFFNELFATIDGAYACVLLVKGEGLFAFRDPRGIRPLCMGTTETEELGHCDIFASETCAIPDGFEIRSLLPAEVVHIDMEGGFRAWQTFPAQTTPCLFEFIYLAHDDSTIDGIHVRKAREEMGRIMRPLLEGKAIDVIVPVPHTPVLAANVLAREMDIPVVNLLVIQSIKARREGRTFILPTQTAREQAVSQKFAIDESLIDQCRDRNVLVLDDSIVRGTTLRHINTMIRQHVKPKSLKVASLAPPIVSPNRYGIDIPDRNRLIALKPQDEIMKELQIDEPIIYQRLDTLKATLAAASTSVDGFEDSVFIR